MKYKILIGVIVAYVIIIGVLLYVSNAKKINIVLYPDVTMQYDGKKWSTVEFDKDKEYNIYTDNKFLSKSRINNEDGEIIIDGETVYDFVASNKKLQMVNFNSELVDDDEKTEILLLAGIKSNFTTVDNKITIDYDKDGKLETIYFLANSYNSGENDDLFSLIYVEDDENGFIYNKKYVSEREVKACDISSIININDDYKFVVKCPGFSDSGMKIQIYEVKNKKLTLVAEI